jgi:hypothetical protein
MDKFVNIKSNPPVSSDSVSNALVPIRGVNILGHDDKNVELGDSTKMDIDTSGGELVVDGQGKVSLILNCKHTKIPLMLK